MAEVCGMKPVASIRDYLDALLADNGIAELRHEVNGCWSTGWFNDAAVMTSAVRERQGVGNLFTSLNAPKPRRVRNRMIGRPVTDADIGWITRLPFDFDPDRPPGMPSADAELAAAYRRRNALLAMLRGIGWPHPLLGRSGNGFHMQYRCRLPNNATTAEILRHIYLGLAQDFGGNGVHFDTKVRNPGRIFRLYGSTNRKGTDTAERPHRMSACILPEPWYPVSERFLERLADHYARKRSGNAASPPKTARKAFTPAGSGDYRSLDIVAWFRAHGLYREPLGNGKHAVTCPWHHAHSTPHGRTGAIVFEHDDGWPGFFCHHAHCEGRNITDVMRLLGDADAYCTSSYRGSARS